MAYNPTLAGGTSSLSTAINTGKQVAQFIPVAGQVLNIASAVGGALGIKGSKDPQRLAANAHAYNFAIRNPSAEYIAADGRPTGMTALEFLLAKSPADKGGGAGWATSATEEDAWAKFQAAKNYLASGNRPTAPGSFFGASFNLQEKSNQYVITGVLILAALYLVKGR